MMKSIIIAVFLSVGLAQASWAVIGLSVNPVDGSNGLRFDRVAMAGVNNKVQIHVRVTSSGDRFQVFQRIFDPIINEKGDSLNLQAIETQTLVNSNSFGILYLQNADHLSSGDQLLYSSSQSGQTDGFMIGYTLNQALINGSGRFRGKLVFTVRGVGNSFSDQVIIDLRLDAFSDHKISIRGGRHHKKIIINGVDTSEKTADFLKVSFKGNSGHEIRIYQEIQTFPVNEMQEELGDSFIQLDPQGQTDGLRIQGLNSLQNNRTLIYSSNKQEDNFIIYFLANASQTQNQQAGVYKGKITYVVETDQAKREFPVDIQCTIQPVFSINLTPEPQGLNFTQVTANGPAQDRKVLVSVVSNLHKPYQVLQNFEAQMTNQKGKEYDSKHLSIQVQIPSDQKGQTNFTEFTPVQTGEYPVFSSDSRGAGSVFTVVYRVKGYAQMTSGNFLAPIKFSLNQK